LKDRLGVTLTRKGKHVEREKQKRPTTEAKETYYRGKRDLLTCVRVSMSREKSSTRRTRKEEKRRRKRRLRRM
jgi:hypothetical protein